ncbi:multidrug transporter MatE [Ureibacillus manganicus DSM 26584]|uniref:Multidrug transporter MatE n=2 Tax=Ureibacillus TaxID=160795 RepID=A0A0A3I748_9BACL|nr:multidrug transporter MatE [Ureibacillus manganicus DSM 26584]
MENKMQNNQMSLTKSMIFFLIPVALSSVLQSAGQIISTIVVGQTLGEDALAAIAAFFPLFFLLVSFAIGVGSGSSILIGQAFGAKNMEKLKEIVGVTIAVTLVISVVVALVGGLFSEGILRLMGTPENILEESASYAQILFVTLPIMFLYMCYTTFIRGSGDSKTPLVFLIISIVLNIAFLPIFMFGWIGFPALGLNGAAYANAVSFLITFIWLLLYLHKKDHVVKLDKITIKNIKIKGDLVKSLLKLAIPSSISMVAISLAGIAVIFFVNSYGSNATASYGIVNQIASYVQIPGMSVAIATSVFVAQAIGAGRQEDLKVITALGLKLSYLFGGILVIIVYLFAEPILRVFLTNPDTISMAKGLMYISFWSYLLLAHVQAISATMRATGTVFWPTVILISTIWIIEVPAAYLLSKYTPLGINGIWLAYPISFGINLGLQYWYYRFVWKKKTIKALVPSASE